MPGNFPAFLFYLSFPCWVAKQEKTPMDTTIITFTKTMLPSGESTTGERQFYLEFIEEPVINLTVVYTKGKGNGIHGRENNFFCFRGFI